MKQIFLKSIGWYINLLGNIYPKEATRLAEKYISEPRKGKLTPNNLPDILKESEQVKVKVNHTNIQTYNWKGNENTILLVHGWESNAARWYKLIPILKQSGYSIVALDAPAHGLSDNKWFNVAKYSESLKVVIEKYNPKIIIGHSIGGTASLFNQYKFPNNNIEKMVLLGSPGELEVMVRNYAYIFGLKEKVIRLMEKKFSKDYNVNFETFSLAKMAESISVKGLIIHDRVDKIVSFREGKKLAESWKNAVFMPTRGLGHGLQDENLYQKVYEFLFPTETAIKPI